MIYLPMAFSTTTSRMRLDLRDEHDAEWNLELLGEHPGPTPYTLSDMRRRLRKQRVDALESGIGLLTIRRLSVNEPLGYCGLIVGRCSIDEPEGVELLRGHHGHGYATEAAQAVAHAAYATGRTRIWVTGDRCTVEHAVARAVPSARLSPPLHRHRSGRRSRLPRPRQDGLASVRIGLSNHRRPSPYSCHFEASVIGVDNQSR
jgi:hypothetical protein